ncbi:MAG: hypothetical protein KJ990_04230 [Proteobacteria bacterium]|nr:hypothetical protein [Pseudomonadota bacterium]MBU1648735.1 hypothetical protein [Pseudomonadota bacterium]
MSIPILTLLIFFPVLGGLILLGSSKEKVKSIKVMALIVSLLEFIFTLPLCFTFDQTIHHLQFVERHSWIPLFDIDYFLGLDAVSMLFILFSTLITILCVLVSWNSIQTKVKGFFVSLLLFEGAMIGAFCAHDLFILYLFREATLIFMLLLICAWNGPKHICTGIPGIIGRASGTMRKVQGCLVSHYLAYMGGGVVFIIILMFARF